MWCGCRFTVLYRVQGVAFIVCLAIYRAGGKAFCRRFMGIRTKGKLLVLALSIQTLHYTFVGFRVSSLMPTAPRWFSINSSGFLQLRDTQHATLALMV